MWMLHSASSTSKWLHTCAGDTRRWVTTRPCSTKSFSDMTKCACRVPYTSARRAACTKTAKLDEIHVIAQQLLQETHLAHCRKNYASYKCRNAQQRILNLLDEARQVQLLLSCGLLLLLVIRPCVTCWQTPNLLLASTHSPVAPGTFAAAVPEPRCGREGAIRRKTGPVW